MSGSEWTEVLHRQTVFGSLHGIEELEKLLNSRDGQGVPNSLAHSGKAEAPSRVLSRYIGTDQSPNASGIGVRNVREVNDESP